MLLAKQLDIGKLKGTVYTCEDVGDTLEMHNHVSAPETAHITIVSKGSFKAFGHGWHKLVSAGDVLDFAEDQWHGFEALEPGSKFVNIIK
jgi:hypothetical protein